MAKKEITISTEDVKIAKAICLMPRGPHWEKCAAKYDEVIMRVLRFFEAVGMWDAFEKSVRGKS